MSNYTTRRRAGGGPNLNAPYITIIETEADGPTTMLVSFTDNINAADFSPSDWSTTPDTRTCDGVTQASDAILALSFTSSPFDQDTLHYNGNAPNVVTPQSVPIA